MVWNTAASVIPMTSSVECVSSDRRCFARCKIDACPRLTHKWVFGVHTSVHLHYFPVMGVECDCLLAPYPFVFWGAGCVGGRVVWSEMGCLQLMPKWPSWVLRVCTCLMSIQTTFDAKFLLSMQAQQFLTQSASFVWSYCVLWQCAILFATRLESSQGEHSEVGFWWQN